jgi:hypothetical protein
MASCRQCKRMSRRQRREQQLRNRRKARQNRAKLNERVSLMPPSLRAFFAIFAPCFTRPTLLRFTLLAVATILTLGCRTVANVLRTVGFLAPGDPSAYRRVFSKRTWSAWRLSRALLGWILDHLVEPGPVHIAADDTVSEHPGDKVYGKGCHRDAVRSSSNYTAFRWGHKWLVLAILIRLPLTNRHWALPVMVALLYSAKHDQAKKRRHKTPAEVLAQMLLVLRRWFPNRSFILAADGAFASHEMAGSCNPAKVQMTLVSRFYANAGLYEPPAVPKLNAKGKRESSGRPRVKGAKLDTPFEAVAKVKERQRLRVQWYGGGERDVETVTGTGHWYKAGQGLVQVRWVFVHDMSGTHRDEYFFSTDVAMTAKQIIETYVRRWNLETTFQEMRSYMGLETTRGWKRNTVRRVEPCLFGLYSVVVCLFSQLPTKYKQGSGISWEGKDGTTFSDAITAVRKWLWVEWIFPAAGQQGAFANLSEDFQDLILNSLAPAA